MDGGSLANVLSQVGPIPELLSVYFCKFCKKNLTDPTPGLIPFSNCLLAVTVYKAGFASGIVNASASIVRISLFSTVNRSPFGTIRSQKRAGARLSARQSLSAVVTVCRLATKVEKLKSLILDR